MTTPKSRGVKVWGAGIGDGLIRGDEQTYHPIRICLCSIPKPKIFSPQGALRLTYPNWSCTCNALAIICNSPRIQDHTRTYPGTVEGSRQRSPDGAAQVVHELHELGGCGVPHRIRDVDGRRSGFDGHGVNLLHPDGNVDYTARTVYKWY